MPQDPSNLSGPYRDPVDNMVHGALTGAGGDSSKSEGLTPEAEAGIKKVNDKIDDTVVNAIKGKAPKPDAPKPPKPEPWMSEKPSYSIARAARKKDS